ncbi:hypothetical protein [Pseudonocardia nigra]|uniref:hypothetical protein n=1 Tax=Pseudonocardia nigra TaxID=1921578 RepID=UPI001C5E0F78|nr:hypothetical protein [Pseudonocardia nigra]
MTTAFVVIAALAAVAALCHLQVSHLRRVRRERRALFADVQDVLDDAVVHQDGLGYPALSGTYRGHPVRLRVVVDTLTLRKLPALWLLITQVRRLDVEEPIDVLLRPSGAEFFSPNAEFAHELPPPDWLPRPARIASPRSTSALPAVEHLAPLLRDPRTKEVLVSGDGVRVVRQLAEGAQGPYRTARRPDFGPVRLLPDGLCHLLDTISDAGDVLAGGEVRSR